MTIATAAAIAVTAFSAGMLFGVWWAVRGIDLQALDDLRDQDLYPFPTSQTGDTNG